MDNDEPEGGGMESLSLPLEVLGDLPARARFHRSQEMVAQAMESLAGQCEQVGAS